MHVSGEAHGQDDEFTAAFEERHAAPADKAGADDADQDKGADAGSDKEPADQGGADPAPTDKAKDPWEGASPELLAERDKLIGERDRFKHSDQSQRGRIASMQRTIDQFRSPPQPQQEQEQPQGKDKEGDEGKEPEADERAKRLANLREDYPDLAGPILDLIDEARREAKAIGDRVSPVIDASNEAAVVAQENALADKHPDWREIGQSQDFVGWAQAQSPQIQALCSSFDAAEVSAALTLFKTERDASKAQDNPDDKKGDDPKPQEQQRDDRRDRQLQGGRERPSRGAPAAAGAPDEFEGAFEFFRQKRERQQKR